MTTSATPIPACWLGDGCLLLLIDEHHKKKYTHGDTLLTKCPDKHCPIYRRCYSYMRDDGCNCTAETLADFEHVTKNYHPPISQMEHNLAVVGGSIQLSGFKSEGELGLKVRNPSDKYLRMLSPSNNHQSYQSHQSHQSYQSHQPHRDSSVPKLPVRFDEASPKSPRHSSAISPQKNDAKSSPKDTKSSPKKQTKSASDAQISPKSPGTLVKKVLLGSDANKRYSMDLTELQGQIAKNSADIHRMQGCIDDIMAASQKNQRLLEVLLERLS